MAQRNLFSKRFLMLVNTDDSMATFNKKKWKKKLNEMPLYRQSRKHFHSSVHYVNINYATTLIACNNGVMIFLSDPRITHEHRHLSLLYPFDRIQMK